MARWRMVSSAAVFALGGATGDALGAEPLGVDALAALPSVSVSGSLRSEALAARVASGVIGAIDPELRVRVVLRDSVKGTTAMVSVALGERQLGRRRLVAADCDEAIDAVVAVAALALSSTGDFVDAEATSAAGEKNENDEVGREHEPAPRLSRAVPAEPLVPGVAAESPALDEATPVDQDPSSDAGARAARISLLLGTGASVAPGASEGKGDTSQLGRYVNSRHGRQGRIGLKYLGSVPHAGQE